MCNCDETKFAPKNHRHDLYVTKNELSLILDDYLMLTDVATIYDLVCPIGTIRLWTNPTMIPSGWLICDGTQYTSGTGGYPALYDVIDEHFHVGESDFVTPDLRGRVPVGLDTSQAEFDAIGETGGAKTHTLTSAENGTHSHTWRARDDNSRSTVTWSSAAGATGNIASGGSTGTATISPFLIDPSGSGSPHNNLQPYLTLTYIIRAA